MTRWKAAAIHLCVSALIGLLTAALVFCVWYPAPYTRASGADQLILMLLGVDICVGPLITLLVYREGKWGMKFDLCVIALLQLAAFVYGMSIVLQARPAFIVGAIDRFVIVPANALAEEDLAAATRPEFRTLSWTGPRVVNALRPEKSSERSDLLFSGAEGKDIELFPKYYADYATHAAPLLARAHPLDTLTKSEAPELIDAWLQKHNRQRADVVWLPLVGRNADIVLLLDRQDGRVLGSLPIEPW